VKNIAHYSITSIPYTFPDVGAVLADIDTEIKGERALSIASVYIFDELGATVYALPMV
jgi:hypothetical protein